MLRIKLVRLVAVTALVSAQACGDDSGAKPAPLDPFGGVDEMDAGPISLDAGKRDASVDAGPVLGPLIEVLSPVETDDPASANVVSGSTLTVRCSMAKNPKGELVDVKTAKVTLYSGDNTKAVISQVATSSAEADVFQAENISLAAMPHGVMRIECSASDVATKVQSSTTSIYTLYDQGPLITFLSPVEKGFVSAGKGTAGKDATVRFKVEPQLLAAKDPGAEIGEIVASISGKTIAKLDESTTEENVYSFDIDFNATQLFSAIPKTLSIRIDASNKRTKSRTTTATLTVGVDSEGPVITVKTPQRVNSRNPIVSGKVDVVLEVKDALAGVNPTSVRLQIKKDGDGTMDYPAVAVGNDLYNVSFDTGSYPDKPSISTTLLAADNVGGESQSSLTVNVDSVPPWISLDPPTVRERTKKAPTDECSGAFDPLGDAVNEGVVIGDAYRVRVLIWDRPLTASGATLDNYALIDNTTPRLYIQHDGSVPLLIDTDGDHECDKVNATMEDLTKVPTTKVLSPVKPVGTAIPSGTWVSNGAMPPTYTFNQNMSADPSVAGLCNSAAATFGSPLPVSPDTTITRVIKHIVPGNWEVVYADSPAASGGGITGVDYYPPPGWACLVASAKDNAGNAAFSPPMRVCAQRAGYTCSSSPPPSLTCTDGCTIPAKFARDAPTAMPRVLDYTN